jgi:hypothetical protein
MRAFVPRAPLTILALFWVGDGWSAASDEQLQRMLGCAAQADDAKRLACYDEYARPASQAVAAPPAAAPVDDFGVARSELARRQAGEKKNDPALVESLVADVTQVSKLPRGEIVITLSNAQVWRQKQPESYFPIKVGDTIRIDAGLLGSYRLSLPNGRTSQVTRVR